MKVFLDTSFLIEMARKKVDGFTGIMQVVDDTVEFCTTPEVWDELKRLSEGKTKEARAAKLAFVLAKQQNLKTVQGFFKRHTDDALLVEAKGGMIATQDAAFKKRAKEANVPVLTIRQGMYVRRG
ncbi:MAG: PIN domain-containing protein [Candidatus Woesearchaeota archaeon]